MFRTALIAGVLLMFGTAFAEAETVEVNGMKMYYEVSGKGEPLVVLHGAYMNIPSMGATIKSTPSSFKGTAAPMISAGRSPIRTWRTTSPRSWMR